MTNIMTQNQIDDNKVAVIKTETITHSDAQSETANAVQRQFLQWLYPQPPAGLWLELRCIHPTTGEVRTLWAPAAEAKKRDAALRTANRLNRDGFGIYFAPCLRQEKSGRADAAALLPALWVDLDCDDAPHQREQALSRLTGFVQPPSLLVDSGGGYHAWFLLRQPYLLYSDAERTRVAGMLQGLFSALGGDEAYVKSVASVMRLPGSCNTKPDRDNAAVRLIESHADRRYAMADFDWLIVDQTARSQAFSLPMRSLDVITLNGISNGISNGNGHHPLPPRTEQYLASGASDGQRNSELFAAACQLRDAGYSQAQAESELIARHIADGTGTESQPAREKEARSTVASAYRQPAREPIGSPRENASRHVEQLVSRYGQPKQDAERPTSDEISQAVAACIHLNPVEWAEQREQFRALTGNGLRITDIDRLYRESKKAAERSQQQEYVETESYSLVDERIVYRRETYRGVSEKTVADWSATALYQTCQVDDDGREAHVTTVELRRGSGIKRLDVPGDVFVDDLALRRFIGTGAGSQYVVRAGMMKHLVPAIVQLSGEYPTHRHYNFMGWKQLDGRWVYLTPDQCISAAGCLDTPPSVELDGRLHDYGLQQGEWHASLTAFDAVGHVLPPDLAACLLAFALFPVVQRFFPATATRPALHLVGTSGSGKSEIASLLSSFYGQFSRDTPPAQWGDTINTVEMLGYPLADALFWVDDYKSIYADERSFTRFLQSYSRSMGRGRLTREAKVRTEKPCRGLILSTGETTIEGEMSVIARMLVLEVPPWEQRDPEGKALLQAEALRDNLPGFTAHFAAWVARRMEAGSFRADIAERFARNKKHFSHRLAIESVRHANTDRVVKNWAALLTVHQLLEAFVGEMSPGHALPAWQDAIVASVRSLRQERASEVFLNILGQLIAGGQAVLDDSMRQPREYPSGTAVVGYRDESFIYLLPDVALREVNRVQPMKFTATAIGMQLKEDGLLLAGTNTLAVQRRVKGARVRFWQLKGEVFGCDSCDSCDSEL